MSAYTRLPLCAMRCVSHLFIAESFSKYIADENKVYDGVSSVPIQLTLSGPDLPTLTLVDLPGECLIATMFVTCTIHSGSGISHVTLKTIPPEVHPAFGISCCVSGCDAAGHRFKPQW